MQTLERDVRFLKVYAAVSTVAIAVLLVAGFASESKKQKFEEIDAERINIVDKDGKLALVISNSERMPPAIVNGKSFKQPGSRAHGLLFYNDKGDEDGGLAFGGRMQLDGKYAADAQIMFDQFNQDQIVGIQYRDDNGKRTAGLRVWDRTDIPLDQIMAKVEGLQGAERDTVLKKLSEQGELAANRVFVGRLPDKSAQMVLSDAKGRPRLTISVGSGGEAKITFLDESGKPVYSLPPAQ